uniref:Large ribosomal subunit protein eL28 n=1 Tax=Globodera rostochiensis TaxID=31243 RepID=A0A914HZC3_GLORO
MVHINNASSYIQWQVIRKNSAFLKRQRGIPKQFSTEPFNLARMNSIRHNGMINKKAVDIRAAKDGKGVVLSLKKKTKAGQPTKATTSTALTRDSRRVIIAVGKAVNAYKPSHAKLAQRRASQILRSQKTKAKPATQSTVVGTTIASDAPVANVASLTKATASTSKMGYVCALGIMRVSSASAALAISVLAKLVRPNGSSASALTEPPRSSYPSVSPGPHKKAFSICNVSHAQNATGGSVSAIRSPFPGGWSFVRDILRKNKRSAVNWLW